MTAINAYRRQRGRVDPRIVAGLVAAAIVVLGGLWLMTRERPPEPVPPPGAPDTVAPAESAAERGDSAREIIDELSDAGSRVDYDEAYRRAREFRQEGRLADAQLLYFFAAQGGHAQAAFDLATFYDPQHHAESASLMEADPFQAYRWYTAAGEAGQDGAGRRLAELRAWAERAANEGDTEAERLLLQWE